MLANEGTGIDGAGTEAADGTGGSDRIVEGAGLVSEAAGADGGAGIATSIFVAEAGAGAEGGPDAEASPPSSPPIADGGAERSVEGLPGNELRSASRSNRCVDSSSLDTPRV